MVETVTTNVPSVTFGPNGFTPPTDTAILTGVIEDYQAAFGGNLNLDINTPSSLTTPQGQLASSTAAIVANTDQAFQFLTQMFDPAYAFGRYQDAIARIYFLERNPSQPTVLQIECIGGVGVVIPFNASVQDASGYTYLCSASGTIPAGGSITLPFANTLPGPLAIPETVDIYQTVPGWDTATVASGVLGQNVESRSAFEQRRALSVAQNSLGSLPSIYGAVAAVPNVIDVFVTENDSNTTATIGGVLLNPNSLYVAVVGGESSAIAQAIWSRKAPGCAYNGNTTVTVLDTASGYNPPYPAYQISFEIPTSLQIVFAVTLKNNSLVPSNAAALIQNAIVNAFAGLDGGTPVQIGTTVFASRYYAPIASLGSWVQIISIELNSLNGAAAQITGSITGTTLTVSATASGALAIGQTLVDATGNLLPNTTITAGSGTSWTVSNSQTVTSETMYGLLASQFDTTVNINQYPVVNPLNITVTLD
jgi:hypothetical protein